MGATKQLADYLVNTNFDDIPAEVVERAKHLFLNFLGVALDGSTAPTSKIVMDHVQRFDAKPESSVIGAKYRTTAAFSAYANGASSHAHELEAVGGSFNSAPSIAVALAMGEKLGLTGKQVIEGFVLGYDVQGRVINGSRIGLGKKGWIMPMNHVGSVAVASKMMALDADQTRAAMGTCLAEASGMQSSAGFFNHYLAFSFPAFNAIDAVEYAKEGLGGNPDIIEVPEGFCDFFAGIEQTDFDAMTRNMGEDFSTILAPGTGIKKYPCCYASHKAIDATLELIREHDIRPEDVESVKVVTNKMIMGWLQYPEPRSEHQSRFSMQHVLAAALLKKRVWLEALIDPNVVEDPAFVEARQKILIEINPDWSPGTEGYRSPVTITLKDGASYEKEVTDIRELSSEELLQLYRTLVEPILPSEKVDRSIDIVMNLEKSDDVRGLMGLYASQ